MTELIIGRASDVEPQDKGEISVRNLIKDLTEAPDVSVSLVTLKGGKNKTVKQEASWAFYYVLKSEGNCLFNIDGENYLAEEGSYFLIPPNTPYYDQGCMDILTVCSPHYDPDKVKYLD